MCSGGAVGGVSLDSSRPVQLGCPGAGPEERASVCCPHAPRDPLCPLSPRSSGPLGRVRFQKEEGRWGSGGARGWTRLGVLPRWVLQSEGGAAARLRAGGCCRVTAGGPVSEVTSGCLGRGHQPGRPPRAHHTHSCRSFGATAGHEDSRVLWPECTGGIFPSGKHSHECTHSVCGVREQGGETHLTGCE